MMTAKRVCGVWVSVVLGCVAFLPAQHHLYSFIPAPPGYVGFAASGVGDVDRDGYADLLVLNAGLRQIELYSGRNGTLARQFSARNCSTRPTA